MPRILALAFVLVAALAPATVGGTAVRKTPPQLSAAKLAPLQLRGRSFRPRESVRIRVTFEGRTLSRVVRSNAAGRFVAGFAGVNVTDPCVTDLSATAIGARGSRARWKLAQPQCPPAQP